MIGSLTNETADHATLKRRAFKAPRPRRGADQANGPLNY